MLYQRVMGDFYPINSEGKFTLSFYRISLREHCNNAMLFNSKVYSNDCKRSKWKWVFI